jgi:hypothetical protein
VARRCEYRPKSGRNPGAESLADTYIATLGR